jgi:hypothetical protein
MKKNYWIIILVLSLFLAGWFYWYQWRPSQIIKVCERESENLSLEDIKGLSDANLQNGMIVDAKTADKQYNEYYNIRYQKCLRNNGIEK